VTDPSSTLNPEARAKTSRPPWRKATPSSQRVSLRRFARHYIEMVPAMLIGMLVLHPVWMFASSPDAVATALAPRLAGRERQARHVRIDRRI
jgi:hypothetical protein